MCPHRVPGWVQEALQRERPLQWRRQQTGGWVLPVPRGLQGASLHRLRGRLLQLSEERDAQRLHRYCPCPREQPSPEAAGMPRTGGLAPSCPDKTEPRAQKALALRKRVKWD